MCDADLSAGQPSYSKSKLINDEWVDGLVTHHTGCSLLRLTLSAEPRTSGHLHNAIAGWGEGTESRNIKEGNTVNYLNHNKVYILYHITHIFANDNPKLTTLNNVVSTLSYFLHTPGANLWLNRIIRSKHCFDQTDEHIAFTTVIVLTLWH